MIEKHKIRIVYEKMGPEQALQQIGNLLEQVGSITKQYTQNMINSYHELGAYFVIAPGIALAHAKPDESVVHDDVVLMVCQQPVVFKSHNDPVTLLFGLCATSSDSHMEHIVEMANLLSDERKIQQIKAATSAKEIEQVLQKEAKREE